MALCRDFAQQSIDLHLFFLRIMKEHSFFLQLGFTPRDANYTQQADAFRMEFDRLLWDVISIADCVASHDVLCSGEVFTQYTLEAEKVSSFYTGVRIPTELTKAEKDLSSANRNPVSSELDRKVFAINRRAINLVSNLIDFKSDILSNVLSCKMFTVNYPLLIDHIMREAKLYLQMIMCLQGEEDFCAVNNALEQELFWNRIMAEHAKFIRGLLDPTEEELFLAADNFGKEFDQLTAESKAAMDRSIPPSQLTADSLQATRAIRDFKAQGTEGLICCKIKSIIIPLLGDHTLREANHFLRLLKMFSR